MHYVATDDFCKVKTVYSISVNLQSLGSVLFWTFCITANVREAWLHEFTVYAMRKNEN
jgi:hypothetical protein